jgi:hypothetical protein
VCLNSPHPFDFGIVRRFKVLTLSKENSLKQEDPDKAWFLRMLITGILYKEQDASVPTPIYWPLNEPVVDDVACIDKWRRYELKQDKKQKSDLEHLFKEWLGDAVDFQIMKRIGASAMDIDKRYYNQITLPSLERAREIFEARHFRGASNLWNYYNHDRTQSDPDNCIPHTMNKGRIEYTFKADNLWDALPATLNGQPFRDALIQETFKIRDPYKTPLTLTPTLKRNAGLKNSEQNKFLKIFDRNRRKQQEREEQPKGIAKAVDE